MRIFTRIILMLSLFAACFAVSSAQSKTTKKSSPTTAKLEAKVDLEKEKAVFEAAQSLTDPKERVEKLLEFVRLYPRSELKNRALESISGARAEVGDALLKSGDTANGLTQFRLAAAEAPAEMSDKLFAGVVSRIPTSLFFRGERAAAIEIAKTVEVKAGENAERLLVIAQFYLITEDAENARRLATRAAALKPDSANAQLALGLANRVGFRLEAASQAFARAVELDAKSAPAKRGLADTLRGLNQNDDAIRIYRELLGENAADEAACTGLVLSLFGAGNQTEAEAEMNAALSANERNYALLAGAAYWYAANGDGKRAIEFGQKAVAAEPRYTWSHIALARGLLLEKRPLEAERALIIARQYGNFPTLDYELANAQFAAGFYEDAAANLRKTFALKNGTLETKLAGRIIEQSNNFVELLALERRAAILQPAAAETEANAAQLKKLLAFSIALNAETKDEAAISETVRDFVAGADAAQTHRQLYAANRLLREKIALPQAYELAQSAINGVDAAMNVPSAEASVLAEELYEPRRLAAVRNGIIEIPKIDRAVLNKVLRGRIEEIAGWTLYNQDKPEEAVVRLKRAIFVLPIESSFWRSSLWRLGAAYERTEKPRDALDAYIRSYRGGQPDELKLAVIQGLHTRIFGSLDGLEAKLDAKSPAVTQPAPKTVSNPRPSAAPKNPLPNIIGEIIPARTQPAAGQNSTVQSAIEKPMSEPAPETKQTPEIKSEPTPAAKTEIETPNAAIIEPPASPKEIEKPKTGETNSPAPETKPNAKSENSSRPRVLIVDRLKNTVTEISPSGATKTETKSDAPESNESATDVRTRERLVACSIWTNQDSISIINNGGLVSLLVGEEGAETLGDLTAISSSPQDVEVKADAAVGKTENRTLFVVRSISETTGAFTVAFESACGKKTIAVKVR